MVRTRVFRNGGSLAVRLPKRFALPVGDVMIEKRDGLLVLLPVNKNDWPSDLESRFSALAGLETPERPQDSKSVEF